MIEKVLALLVCLELARGATIGTYFSPSTIASSASINFAPNPKARPTPAPIYETEATDQEIAISRANEQGFFTPYDGTSEDSGKYDVRINRPSTLNVPTRFSPTIGKPVSYYPTNASPFVPNVESGPVTYTTHTHSTPLVENAYSTPLKIKTSLGYSNIPLVQNTGIKTKIVYDAPSVSHVSFEGLGTTYRW